MQSLSGGDRALVDEQRIPSLEQALEAAKESNISIMFDLRPENHSDYWSFVNATLDVILKSGIPLQKVSWPPPHCCWALLSPCCSATQSTPTAPHTPWPHVLLAGHPVAQRTLEQLLARSRHSPDRDSGDFQLRCCQ